MSETGYAIAWDAGASAQIELFSPDIDAKGTDYRLKFTPPMRKTIRPPLTDLRLGRGELGPITARLNSLVEAVNARGPSPPAGARPGPPILDQAQEVGGLLHSLVVPNDVQIELETEDLFLEIGVDEVLLEYPWELLHDGDDFLCLKHCLGRFVNVSRAAIPSTSRSEAAGTRPLSMLLISVPTPQPRGNNLIHESLTGVNEETDVIVAAITGLGPGAKLTVLAGPDATWTKVASAIKKERFHIVHYCGHAYFDSATPYNSSLVLYDQDMTTGHVKAFFGNQPPVLFFINGCETAVTQGKGEVWKNRYDIFGLARAFLETGAYLLGNRWKVGDKGAARFAAEFYARLLDEKSLGWTIREARIACKKAKPEDFSWASYIYYGDPRLRFRKVETPKPAG